MSILGNPAPGLLEAGLSILGIPAAAEANLLQLHLGGLKVECRRMFAGTLTGCMPGPRQTILLDKNEILDFMIVIP